MADEFMTVKHKRKLNERDRLENFLCWLLDPRWFPVTDKQLKKNTRARLRTFRSILKRMERFARRFKDVRLQRGLDEWKNYEQDLQQICRSTIRRSPTMQTTSQMKAEMVIAERLLCATLIIPKLKNGESIYRKIKEFLDEPSTLKHDTASLGYIELCNRTKGGYRIERIRHVRSEKALQSLVQRLRNNIKTRHSAYVNDLDVLRNIYSQYCWQSLGQSGFSDSEADMLAALVSGPVDQKKRRSARDLRTKN